MTIDFPDKLRSTRRDRKLVDAGAIDGLIQLAQLAEDARSGAGHVWRPFFFVLENVGPAGIEFSTVRRGHIYSYDQTNETWNRTANLVSQAAYDQSGDRLLVGTNRVRTNGSTQQDLSVLPEGETPSSFEYPWSASPPVSLSDSEKLFVIWAHLGTPITDDQNAVAIVGPVEMAGGYHAEAAHAINQLTPLIEQEFDGTTGDTTSEQEVAGVTIENVANVAYAIHVGAETEFTLGNALRGVRSSSPLQVGHANFYTKANDDKLYRTLDSASDGTLEIWQVNDLAALRAALAAAAGDDDGGIAGGLEPLEPLDGASLSVGDVVLSEHAFHRYATPGTANAFAGVLGTYREQQTYYLVTSRSDSHFGAHGRFTDNHGAAIGAVLVGQGTNNVMEVQIDKAAYEAAKGSAIASGDEISAAFTGTVSGSDTTTTHVLPYVRSFTVGGKTWLSFEGQAPNSVPKRVGTHPDGWSLIVSQGGSVLLTHAVDDSHFTEYPIEAIDQAARDAANAAAGATNVRDALQTLTGDARLDASAVKDLPQPVAGLAGLRTESISFREDIAESPSDELTPLTSNAIVVVHGDGDPEILTGLSGNDFTVHPGLYFLQATGNQDGSGLGHFVLQFRRSLDNAVIAAMPNIFFYNTGEQPFTSSAYWHVTEAVEVNLFLARFDSRAVGVADLVVSFARLTAEDTADRHVIEPLEPLDTDEANDGEVVLSEHEFYVRQPGHGTANTFAGELERWTDGADTWLGTAIRNSVYGQRGQFSSNPDSNVGVLLAGVSADNANTIDVWIRKAAYDAALGRSAQAGDTVKLVITGEVSGTATTVTSTLAYAVFHGDSGYYSFSAVDAANVLRQLADGAAWSMVVNRSNDTPLLTHAAGAAHFVEYPIRSAIDQYARDVVAQERDSLRSEIDQIHAYIGHHIAETFDVPLDPTAQNAPDRYYLTRKGRVSNVALETGLYERTTGVADRLKLTLERITLRDGETVVHGVNTRSFLGPDGGLRFGTVDHNPLSIFQALWLEGDWLVACFKNSWFADRENRQLTDIDGVPSLEKSLLWLHVYEAGSDDPIEIELGQQSVVAGLGQTFVRGEIQYALFSRHVPSEANKDIFRHLFPFVSGTSGPREATVTVDIALSPVSRDSHQLANPHYRLGRTAGDTMAYTWRAATESRLATNFNALVDLLAGGADLASIPDASLTSLKL